MKLAVTGKGGVGKTTLSSLLARVFAADGYKVLAIDANPDANLATALGISPENARAIVPIAEMEELVEERTGAKPGTVGAMFKLNPRVDDIPDRFSTSIDGVKLLVMGTVKAGGAGCICPESSLLKSLVRHLMLQRSEVVIMDMDAGVEHLGRGTTAAMDALIVVVEPGKRSIQTAQSVRALAHDLGVDKCYVVGSKTRSEEDRRFIVDNLPDFEVLGFIDFSESVRQADLKGVSAYDTAADAVAAVRQIKGRLELVSSARRATKKDG